MHFRFRSVQSRAVPMLFQSIPPLSRAIQFRFFSVRCTSVADRFLDVLCDSGSCRFQAIRCHSTAIQCDSIPPLRASKHFPCCASRRFSKANRSVAKLFWRFSLLCKSFAFRFSTGLCNSYAYRGNSVLFLRLYVPCISASVQSIATPVQVCSPHFQSVAMQFRFNSLLRFAIPLQLSALQFRSSAPRPMQFRSMVRTVQNRSPGVTPRMSAAFRRLSSVGCVSPDSHWAIAACEILSAEASSLWERPAFSRKIRIFSNLPSPSCKIISVAY